MASYRSQPDSSSYDSRSYHPSSYHHDSHYRDPQRPSSRSSSKPTHDGFSTSPQQPLHNALNNAFDKSDSASKVDPHLIAQITAEVKKSVLDEIKMGLGVTAQPAQSAPPQPYPPTSPGSATSMPSRNVYTPPSPRRPDLPSHSSASPDPLACDPLFDGASDTPTPKHDDSAPADVPHEKTSSRPAPPFRMSTDGFTPIEKMWQHLFDPQGQPTPRLGQFLRGLAVHLVGDATHTSQPMPTPNV